MTGSPGETGGEAKAGDEAMASEDLELRPIQVVAYGEGTPRFREAVHRGVDTGHSGGILEAQVHDTGSGDTRGQPRRSESTAVDCPPSSRRRFFVERVGMTGAIGSTTA